MIHDHIDCGLDVFSLLLKILISLYLLLSRSLNKLATLVLQLKNVTFNLLQFDLLRLDYHLVIVDSWYIMSFYKLKHLINHILSAGHVRIQVVLKENTVLGLHLLQSASLLRQLIVGRDAELILTPL